MMWIREREQENLLVQLGYNNGGKENNSPCKKDRTSYVDINTMTCKNTKKVKYNTIVTIKWK